MMKQLYSYLILHVNKMVMLPLCCTHDSENTLSGD